MAPPSAPWGTSDKCTKTSGVDGEMHLIFTMKEKDHVLKTMNYFSGKKTILIFYCLNVNHKKNRQHWTWTFYMKDIEGRIMWHPRTFESLMISHILKFQFMSITRFTSNSRCLVAITILDNRQDHKSKTHRPPKVLDNFLSSPSYPCQALQEFHEFPYTIEL